MVFSFTNPDEMEKLQIEDTIIEKRGNKIVAILIGHELMSTNVARTLRELGEANCTIAIVSSAKAGEEDKALEEGFTALDGVYLSNLGEEYLSAKLLEQIPLVNNADYMLRATILAAEPKLPQPRTSVPVRQFNNTSVRFNQKRMLRNHRR